ncbi:hypothetical protein Sinac_4479 [Singulisphaera acidiphila DSM 18658]|uniref:Uncharacterized protein n=1 Tax=Singulisphaera acidiphila (strain ATCC BAA-1392 / DSM 18658 / VKM B-2454 / MOB10) TaxID=886293 RepID=L0DHD1_SINAD|nr:hypothetical protein Sinac_4479 [Singulisphaera acidiphila DSM 18658]
MLFMQTRENAKTFTAIHYLQAQWSEQGQCVTSSVWVLAR